MMVLVNQVTVDLLERYDEQQEAERMAVLLKDEMLLLGKAYRAQLQLLDVVEIRCRIRAHRLRSAGWQVKDIAEAFDVERTTVRSWLKKVKPSVLI